MNRRELADWAGRFGVPESQVQRDELISHVLASVDALDEVVFIGGTALCRTHLPDHRLSEDIDLLAPDAAATRAALDAQVPQAIRRMYPGATLDWDRQGSTWLGELVTADRLTVRVQVVESDAGYRAYPVERRSVALRYADLPEQRMLTVPTATGAAAMKLNAWADRASPRDLVDLDCLRDAGHLDLRSIEVARAVSRALQPHSFAVETLPTEQTWQASLRAQMNPLPDVRRAFHDVRTVVAKLANWSVADEWMAMRDRLHEDLQFERLTDPDSS